MREVYVNPFYMDAVEVTTSRYAKFLEANGALAPPDEWDQVDLKKNRDVPVVGVSWNDATPIVSGSADACRPRRSGEGGTR